VLETFTDRGDLQAWHKVIAMPKKLRLCRHPWIYLEGRRKGEIKKISHCPDEGLKPASSLAQIRKVTPSDNLDLPDLLLRISSTDHELHVMFYVPQGINESKM